MVSFTPRTPTELPFGEGGIAQLSTLRLRVDAEKSRRVRQAAGLKFEPAG